MTLANEASDYVRIEICESSKSLSDQILRANIQAEVSRKNSFSICKILQQVSILKNNVYFEGQDKDTINGKLKFKIKEDQNIHFCSYKLLPDVSVIQELVTIIDQVTSERQTIINLYNKLSGLESALDEVLPMDCSNEFSS